MSAIRLGLLAALAAAVIWGAMFAVLKHLLLTLDPYWLTSIRYLGASAILAVALLVAEGPQAFILDRRAWPLWAIGTAGIAAFNLLVLTGLERTSAEHGALLVAMGPAMVSFVLWARGGAAPGRVTLAMIALAFAGVAIVVTKGNLMTLDGGSITGDLLVVAGVVGIAIYTALTPLFSDYSRIRFTALSLILGTVSTLVATTFATTIGIAHIPTTAPDASVVLGMLYMIVFPAVLAFVFWNAAVSKLGAQNTGLFMNVVPIAAFALGIALGRHHTTIEYAGAAITIAALVINNLANRPAVPNRPRPA